MIDPTGFSVCNLARFRSKIRGKRRGVGNHMVSGHADWRHMRLRWLKRRWTTPSLHGRGLGKCHCYWTPLWQIELLFDKWHRLSFAKEQFSSDKLSSPKYTSFSKFIERWKSIFFLYIRWFETSSFDPRQVMNRRLFLFVFFQKKGSKFQKRRSVSCKFQQCTSLHSPTIRKTDDCRQTAAGALFCSATLPDFIRKTLSDRSCIRKPCRRCFPTCWLTPY